MEEVFDWFYMVNDMKVHVFGYEFSNMDIAISCILVSGCFFLIRKLMDI